MKIVHAESSEKMDSMLKIKAYLRSYKKTPETGVIWVDFYINRQRVHFTTRVSCKVKDWNEHDSYILHTDPNSRDKNLIIENIIARINNVFVKFRLKDRKMTRDSFLRAYNRPSDYDNFFAFYKDYMKKYSWQIEKGTWQTHKAVMDKLEAFNADLHFDDMDSDWLDRYYSYLRKDLENNENTAYKNMSVIRKYVNAAFKAGYFDENPFANWRIKRGKANYTYLSEDELNKFVHAYTTGQFEHKYHKTLEFFLFMCFSSLHVTDALHLKLEQFNGDSFTYYRVKNRNSKPEPIVVPVSDSLRKIITNVVGTRKKGEIFEHMPAPQTMNDYLKVIAAELEVQDADKLSHKAGRHTFATFYLAKTKDLASLKEILGHSELRETLIYAHVLDESKQEGIKFFDEFKL